MSRSYNMFVSIRDYNRERLDAIKDAGYEEWNLQNWEEGGGLLTADENGSLAGGETEEEFADRLVKAIWQATGGFCPIEVRATYLEELPHEDYCFDEESYLRLTGQEVPTTDST